MLTDERVLEWVDQNLDRAWLKESLTSRLIKQALDLYLANQWTGSSCLFNQGTDEPASRLLAAIATRPPLHESAQQAAADCLTTLHREWIDQRLKEINRQMSSTGLPSTEILRLQKEKFDLKQSLRQIGVFSPRHLN
jgi:phosphoribosylaminoimidazole carboxylase (NCAIR synthetase)